MGRVKKWLQRLIFLPLPLAVLIIIPAFVLVGYVLIENKDGWLAYVAYFISAYALVIAVDKTIRLMIYLKRRISAHPLGKRLLEDKHFRTEIALYKSFTIDLFYIMTEIICGFYYRSLWFGFLAGYYTLLAIMRFLLFSPLKDAGSGWYQKESLRRYRLCGVLLMVLNQPLAGMVVFIVKHHHNYDYPGTLIYAMAAYAFYAMTLAIINIMKYHRHANPILAAVKVIDLVAAMVSILALEMAMLAQFGGSNDQYFRQIMTGITGGSICILVLGMAFGMIIQATKSIKQIERANFERMKK